MSFANALAQADARVAGRACASANITTTTTLVAT